MKYEPVIGLEIHVELATKSKMFCSCSAEYFGEKPNTHTCPVCLGLPGAMPTANKKAIKYAQMLGMALHCENPLSSKFDRKNYFYPDLAKGFQISQYDLPFSENGSVTIKIDDETEKIGITRAHMEEDTGKLAHAIINGRRVTLIDFNRSGVPLVEIVSEPQMHSAEEAKAYAQKIQQVVRFLEISEADMEKGSMRIEPNISLRLLSKTRLKNDNLPSYKVELKNINSFRFAQKAINYEIERQSKILDDGKIPIQETRGWDEVHNKTVSQRSKEKAQEYRYFPEPDLTPYEFKEDYMAELKAKLPELPDVKFDRFKNQYLLSDYDSEILTRDRQTADYFEEAANVGRKHNLTPKQIANVIINKKPDTNKILPAELIQTLVASLNTVTTDEQQLDKVVSEVIKQNPKAVEDYKKGKENAIMFLTGQVMRRIKADSNEVQEKLKERLK